MGKLTLAQHCALVDLSERNMSAHDMGARLKTLWALHGKGLAVPDFSDSAPHIPGNMTTWTITDAGRRALSEGDRHGSR